MATDIEDILARSARQLQDVANISWPDTTVLMPYLNYGILEIMNLKPDAYPTTKNLILVPGVIQSLPTGDIAVIDIVCNMGASGTTVGKAITSLVKEQLDEIFPDWMTYPTSDVVRFAIIDSRNPKTYYIFPPQPNPVTQQLRAVVTSPPPEITATTDTFVLDVSYKPACVDYIVYRALAEETTVPNALQKSTFFYNKFMQDLGLKTNVEQQTDEKGK